MRKIVADLEGIVRSRNPKLKCLIADFQIDC